MRVRTPARQSVRRTTNPAAGVSMNANLTHLHHTPRKAIAPGKARVLVGRAAGPRVTTAGA